MLICRTKKTGVIIDCMYRPIFFGWDAENVCKVNTEVGTAGVVFSGMQLPVVFC